MKTPWSLAAIVMLVLALGTPGIYAQDPQPPTDPTQSLRQAVEENVASIPPTTETPALPPQIEQALRMVERAPRPAAAPAPDPAFDLSAMKPFMQPADLPASAAPGSPQASILSQFQQTRPATPAESLAPSLQQAIRVNLAGQIGGISYSIAVQGTLAYVGIGPRLATINIADPFRPTLVGQTKVLPGLVRDIALDTNRGLAYVAADTAGLRVINIANPAAPTEIGALDTPGFAASVEVVGNYAYVADEDKGLRIINITTPSRPVEFGAIGTPSFAVSVDVVGTFAYVATYDAGLRIINVANPRAPANAGSFDTPGTAWAVTVVGGRAYIADGVNGLVIVNVSNPAAPTPIGGYDTPGLALSVTVVGPYAYVGDFYNDYFFTGYAGALRIINITNPSRPIEVGVVTTPGGVWGTVVVGNLAYVVNEMGGMRIIDVSSTLETMFEIGAYVPDGGGVIDVAVAGFYTYVAAGEDGLQIIDVFDPTNPQQVGQADTSGIAFGVTVFGNYAYVVGVDDETGFLDIFDIRDPTEPDEVGSIETPTEAQRVVVANGYAYVSSYTAGMRIIDVTDPSDPDEVGFYIASGGAVHQIALAGNLAYLAAGNGGLHVVDISNPRVPRRLSSTPTQRGALGVALQGNYAYVAAQTAGLRVIDISNPSILRTVGTLDPSLYGEAWGVAVSGNQVFLTDGVPVGFPNAGGGAIHVIDVANRALPVKVNTFDTGAYAYTVVEDYFAYVGTNSSGLRIIHFSPLTFSSYAQGGVESATVVGNMVYSAVGTTGMRIYNVSNPAAPSLAGGFNTISYAIDVAVQGNFAYIADIIGLYVVDISNPAAVQFVSYYDLPALDVAVRGNYAYVAAGGGLLIYDVSNPADPLPISIVDTPGFAWRLAIAGNYAYVADDVSGLQIIDISNPLDPHTVGTLDTPGFVRSVSVVGNYAYLADEAEGLRIVNIANPAAPTEVSSLDTPGIAWGVEVAQGSAYVADGYAGLRVINVSNPAIPTNTGSYDTVGYAVALSLAGNHAYVADESGGLAVLRREAFQAPLPNRRSFLPLVAFTKVTGPPRCDQFEPNNSRYQNPAGPLVLGRDYQAKICSYDLEASFPNNRYEDNYAINVTNATQIVISLSLPPNLRGKTLLWLYDRRTGMKEPICGTDNAGGIYSCPISETPKSGPYILSIYTDERLQNPFDDTNPYTLRVTQQ